MSTAVTSESRINIADLQQITPRDLTDSATLAQASTDNVVENCLVAGLGYTGLSATAGTLATTVVISDGWLIKGGPAYALRDPYTVDLASVIAAIPDATKSAIVLIVADGQEAPTQETRTFLDASKKPTNPADPWPTVTLATKTRYERTAVISKIAGAIDVQPQPPAYNAALCLIATVVVTNAGVLSVTQVTDQQITRLDQVVDIVEGLAAYQSTLPGIINGLKSSVSALALALTNLRAQEQADITNLQNQINANKTQASAPATSIFTGADYFQSLAQSNPAAAGYNAVVSGGLRFALSGTSGLVPIAAQNPLSNTLQQGTGTLLYPALSLPLHEEMGDPDLSLAKSSSAATNNTFALFGNFGSLSTPVKRRGFARSRVRASIGLKASSPAQVLANGDPSQIFAIDPTSFVYDQTNWGPWQTPTTEITRQNGFWSDLAARDYWSPILGIGDTGGLPIVSQPYQRPTSAMLSNLVLVTNGQKGGNLRLLVCADNNGKPDFTRTFADVAAVVPSDPTLFRRITFAMPYPILLKGGVGYHFVFTADTPTLGLWAPPHSGNPGNAQADYLTYANGTWIAPQADTRLSLILGFATFANTTIRIPLAPLQLANGGDTVDFQASLLLPEGCTIGYEVNIGGQWVSLATVLNSSNPLAGNPSNIPCNLVLSGTNLVAPIIDTAASVSRLSKSSAALDHVSAVQNPSAAVKTINKSVTVENWNSTLQTLDAKLRTGPALATPGVAPTSTKDTLNADGSLTRAWSWTLGAAVPSFAMDIVGTTTDPTQTFVGRSSNWDASP